MWVTQRVYSENRENEGGSIVTSESIRDFRESGRVLIRDTGFMYLLPHPALRKWISNYTITFPYDSQMSNEYAIIPHGSATLVFSSTESNISGELFGPMTRPICVGKEANSSNALFIVEFQPAGYYAFSGIPQKELTDLTFPLKDVNPELFRGTAHQFETASTIESFVEAVDELLMTHLNPPVWRQEFSFVHQMIQSGGGVIPVKKLSQNAFYSERHLSRIFDQYMGVQVKSFSRLVRLNRAIRLLRHPHNSMTQVYLQTGYYDMPHFIHDFKSICGITPQAYRDNMSDFYSEIAKF